MLGDLAFVQAKNLRRGQKLGVDADENAVFEMVIFVLPTKRMRGPGEIGGFAVYVAPVGFVRAEWGMGEVLAEDFPFVDRVDRFRGDPLRVRFHEDAVLEV